MNLPKVSIIMSVYNGEQFIEETIQSVLKQKYENFELIIVDDASDDNTVEIIKKFDNERIIIIENKDNMRLAYNLNAAIKISTGKYIARIDADDIFLKNRLIAQVEYMEANPETLILGGYARQFGDEKRLLKYPLTYEEIKVTLMFENSLCHPSVIFKNNQQVISYNTQFKASQDYELWTRLIWENKIENIPETLVKYRIHKKQTKHVLKDEQNSGARYARVFMLKKILGSVSERQEEIFISACNIHIAKSKKELEEIISLFNNILKKNRNANIYNHELLENIIGKIYMENYYVSLKKEYIPLSILFKRANKRIVLSNFIITLKIALYFLRQYIKRKR